MWQQWRHKPPSPMPMFRRRFQLTAPSHIVTHNLKNFSDVNNARLDSFWTATKTTALQLQADNCPLLRRQPPKTFPSPVIRLFLKLKFRDFIEREECPKMASFDSFLWRIDQFGFISFVYGVTHWQIFDLFINLFIYGGANFMNVKFNQCYWIGGESIDVFDSFDSLGIHWNW